MKNKKHIDELFKEQLQNFEAAPSPQVWMQIQTRLKKEKDDRKVIPIWWKLGGVAALLVLLLALNFVFQPFAIDQTPVLVIEDPETTLPIDNNTNPVLETVEDSKAITLENEKDELNTKESMDSEKSVQEKITNESQKSKNAIAETPKSKSLNEDSPYKNPNNNTIVTTKTKDAVAANSEKNDVEDKGNNNTTTLNKDNERNKLIKKDPSEGIGINANTAVGKVSEKVNTTKDPQSKNDINPKTTVVGDKNLEETITKEVVGIAEISENEKNEAEEKVTEEANKKSIFDAIEEGEEETIAKKEDGDLKNWEVTPNFGPVFYNSLSEGSSIDPTFSDNSQSGDVNFSYGVQISYAISDRFSVRTGVSNVDLGYSTGGVEIATGPTALALNSVDYGGKSVVVTAVDRGTLANRPPSDGEGNFGSLNPKSTGGNAEIIQNLSYYEVPMELKYALFNKRFGLNMIGGFSTLFLGDNEISVRDGAFRDVLGEANNLNSVSFTTNVGMGFDYKISKRLKFNIEPMFKYQLNPYTDSSVDFKPYYFGVYSGLSFRF